MIISHSSYSEEGEEEEGERRERERKWVSDWSDVEEDDVE